MWYCLGDVCLISISFTNVCTFSVISYLYALFLYSGKKKKKKKCVLKMFLVIFITSANV